MEFSTSALNPNGDKITPKIVNVRDFGELNNIVW